MRGHMNEHLNRQVDTVTFKVLKLILFDFTQIFLNLNFA